MAKQRLWSTELIAIRHNTTPEDLLYAADRGLIPAFDIHPSRMHIRVWRENVYRSALPLLLDYLRRQQDARGEDPHVIAESVLSEEATMEISTDDIRQYLEHMESTELEPAHHTLTNLARQVNTSAALLLSLSKRREIPEFRSDRHDIGLYWTADDYEIGRQLIFPIFHGNLADESESSWVASE